MRDNTSLDYSLTKSSSNESVTYFQTVTPSTYLERNNGRECYSAGVNLVLNMFWRGQHCMKKYFPGILWSRETKRFGDGPVSVYQHPLYCYTAIVMVFRRPTSRALDGFCFSEVRLVVNV